VIDDGYQLLIVRAASYLVCGSFIPHVPYRLPRMQCNYPSDMKVHQSRYPPLYVYLEQTAQPLTLYSMLPIAETITPLYLDFHPIPKLLSPRSLIPIQSCLLYIRHRWYLILHIQVFAYKFNKFELIPLIQTIPIM
jgi:hypothetical protein